ncbi:MAG: alpha/beta hydrolase [Polyangiaceae bacterium]|nr:alpha/beta hydrolase [Polyangiaceae bacterium]
MSSAEMRLTRDVTARGVRMRVIEAGDERLEPVVLLHDFLASHLEFDDVIDALARRFHVIAPDLPGFGASEKPTPSRYPYGVESFAEAAADLIAAYGLGPACVLGHGLGGAIAITLVSQHMELVKRAVLVGALCYPLPVGLGARLRLWPVVGGAVFKQLFGRRQFRKFFQEHVFSPGAALPLERIAALYEHFNTPSARESAYAVLRSMADTRSVTARVSRIRRPVLVVWGRDDVLYPPALALRLVREMPGARLEFFDAGHSPHEERPSEFVAVVTQFFEGKR